MPVIKTLESGSKKIRKIKAIFSYIVSLRATGNMRIYRNINKKKSISFFPRTDIQDHSYNM